MKCFVAMLALMASSLLAYAAEDIVPASNAHPSQPSSHSVVRAASTADEDAAAETALLESINRSREQAGVGQIRMDEGLRRAARLHAQKMVGAQRLEHQLPGEQGLLQRIAAVSTLPLDRAGENIANVTCAGDAHDVLMHSAPHRRTILDHQFNLAGIAAIWSHGRLYVVEDFAHAMPKYSPRQAANLVGDAIGEARQASGLNALGDFAADHLDDAACSMAVQGHPNAHLIAASYDNRRIITYTQSSPEVLPPGAKRVLNNPGLRQFAVGSCYARNQNYPTGIYWVAILLN